MKQHFNIIGIGEVLWDVFPDGPRFGGAPANMVCAIAGLMADKTNVSMVSAVGDDALGTDAFESFKQHNVNIAALQTNEFPTGTVTVNTDESGQATYQFANNCAWDNLMWCEPLTNQAAAADAVCFGTLAQRSNKSRETIQKFIQASPNSALKICDVNLRVPFYTTDIIKQSLTLANVLKLNEDELPIIANILDISGTTLTLLKNIQQQYQLTSIALTKGEKGATLIHQNQHIEVPIVPTTIVDTVGAGDAFTAAFTLGLLRRMPLEEIGRFATQVSSYVCSKRGATPQLSNTLFN